MMTDHNDLKKILERHKVYSKELLDDLCAECGIEKPHALVKQYFVIVLLHHKHGFNICSNKGKVGELISETDDRLFLKFLNGTTAFISRKYTEEFVPFASSECLHDIQMQYEYGRDWRQKLKLD